MIKIATGNAAKTMKAIRSSMTASDAFLLVG